MTPLTETSRVTGRKKTEMRLPMLVLLLLAPLFVLLFGGLAIFVAKVLLVALVAVLVVSLLGGVYIGRGSRHA